MCTNNVQSVIPPSLYLFIQNGELTYSEVNMGGQDSVHPHLITGGEVQYSGINHGVRPEGEVNGEWTMVREGSLEGETMKEGEDSTEEAYVNL